MIKTQHLVPEVYYNKSRDFQALGRTFDLIFNYLKTNIDIIYNHPFSELSDDRLVELMSLTLGFKSRHNYNVKQLTAMCSAFVYILRNKGSLTGIETAVNILLNAEGIKEKATVYISDDNNKVTIFIPTTLTDTNLLNDLLVYIMPAGTACEIIKTQLVSSGATDEFGANDSLGWAWKSSADMTSKVPQYISGGLDGAAHDDSIGNSVVVPYIDEEDRDTDVKLWPKDE